VEAATLARRHHAASAGRWRRDVGGYSNIYRIRLARAGIRILHRDREGSCRERRAGGRKLCCGDECCTEGRAREQDLRAVDKIAAVYSERECAGCKGLRAYAAERRRRIPWREGGRGGCAGIGGADGLDRHCGCSWHRAWCGVNS